MSNSESAPLEDCGVKRRFPVQVGQNSWMFVDGDARFGAVTDDLDPRCSQGIARSFRRSRTGTICVMVAGIDDLPWTAGFRPRLTVIAQSGRAMGREAGRLLLDRIAKRRTDAPVRTVLPTELHVRGSCGANQPREL